MRTLGAVLAGGRSRRFGSDKAEALLDGRTLIEHAVAALREQCQNVLIVGRFSPIATSAADWPAPGMGPLGGLAGALRYAAGHGYAQVLSIPVDCVRLPPGLREMLEPAPACLQRQPVIGLWPVDVLAALESLLGEDRHHSVRGFAEEIGARSVTVLFAPPNINTPADLQRVATAEGAAPKRQGP